MKGHLFVVAATILVSLTAVPAAFADGGVSEAAHQCRDGGYATLYGTGGVRFESVGACVSYAARGGEFVSVSLKAVPGGVVFPIETGAYPVTITGTGLLPGSIVKLWISGPGASDFGGTAHNSNHVVGSDGTLNDTLPYLLACAWGVAGEGGFGFDSVYATGINFLGEPITSEVAHAC